LGFDVIFRKDANREEMNEAIDEFLGRLTPDVIGLVFYAGHGVQIKSENFLIPTDLKQERENTVIHNGINVARLMGQIGETKAKFTLMILDACRDNPFKDSSGTRGGVKTRGLSAPSTSATGIMVVYSAGANQTALDRLSDRDNDPNGLFTRELLKVIKKPGLTVQNAVYEIRTSVIEQAKQVNHTQTPAIYDESVGSFYFVVDPNQKVTITIEPKTASLGNANDKVQTQSQNQGQISKRAYFAAVDSQDTPGLVTTENRFSLESDGSIFDRTLNKRWVVSDVDGVFEWPDAEKHARQMGPNVRVPTLAELRSLMSNKKATGEWGRVDEVFFPKNQRTNKYWTKTANWGGTQYYVDLAEGSWDTLSPLNSLAVIGIRD